MTGRSAAALAVRLAGALMLVGTVGTFVWLGFGRGTHPTAPAVPAPTVVMASVASVPATPRPPAILVEVADGTAIMQHRATNLTIYRMAENPDIMVLDFASLHDQGQMLNRLAAMVEKNGVPHDRVLDDAGLDRVIRDKKAEPDTFYYGHDYGLASIEAFFAAADRQHLALSPDEEQLRALIGQEHPKAVISIPQPNAKAGVDASMRETIFKHERSHGEYFSNPAYAAFARQFWTATLTEAERTGFKHYLETDDYDPAILDLMINETQAYLVHTRDPRFFKPAAAGLAQAEVDRLRSIFVLTMPPGWLRDCFTPAGPR